MMKKITITFTVVGLSLLLTSPAESRQPGVAASVTRIFKDSAAPSQEKLRPGGFTSLSSARTPEVVTRPLAQPERAAAYLKQPTQETEAPASSLTVGSMLRSTPAPSTVFSTSSRDTDMGLSGEDTPLSPSVKSSLSAPASPVLPSAVRIGLADATATPALPKKAIAPLQKSNPFAELADDQASTPAEPLKQPVRSSAAPRPACHVRFKSKAPRPVELTETASLDFGSRVQPKGTIIPTQSSTTAQAPGSSIPRPVAVVFPEGTTTLPPRPTMSDDGHAQVGKPMNRSARPPRLPKPTAKQKPATRVDAAIQASTIERPARVSKPEVNKKPSMVDMQVGTAVKPQVKVQPAAISVKKLVDASVQVGTVAATIPASIIKPVAIPQARPSMVDAQVGTAVKPLVKDQSVNADFSKVKTRVAAAARPSIKHKRRVAVKADAKTKVKPMFAVKDKRAKKRPNPGQPQGAAADLKLLVPGKCELKRLSGYDLPFCYCAVKQPHECLLQKTASDYLADGRELKIVAGQQVSYQRMSKDRQSFKLIELKVISRDQAKKVLKSRYNECGDENLQQTLVKNFPLLFAKIANQKMSGATGQGTRAIRF